MLSGGVSVARREREPRRNAPPAQRHLNLDGETSASSGRRLNAGKRAKDFTYLLPGVAEEREAAKKAEEARKKTWADVRGTTDSSRQGPQRPPPKANDSAADGRADSRSARGTEDSRNNRRQRRAPNEEEAKPLKWGKAEDNEDSEEEFADEYAQKANFGLSGALAKDEKTGNVYKGIVLKWREPEEARKPKRRWRLYEWKGSDHVATLHVHRQSAYLIGA